MSKVLILILFSVSNAFAFYPAENERSRALFQELSGKKTVIEKFLKSQMERSESNYEVKMKKVPAAEGTPPAEFVPVVDRKSRKLIIELRITEEGLKSPLVMAEEVMKLNQITEEFTHPYEWAETVANAKSGSIRANERLARMDYKVAKDVKGWLEVNTTFFQGQVDPAKLEEWGKLRTEEALARYTPIAKAAKIESDRLQAEWETNRPRFTQLEAQDKKFNDLVMANDRAGARRMLEEYLPWTLMEPSESRAWKAWLEAMEHPNLANRQLVFRGMDGYPILKKAGSESVGVFSSLLAMNQGNYTRRLRSLETSRQKAGRLQGWASDTEDGPKFPKEQPSIVDQMKSHAADPVGSPFISVSDNAIATRFGSQERMALLVDEARLVPNALAFGFQEYERLIPLVVFPDEVVYYQGKKSRTEYTPINDEEFMARVAERLGRPVTAAEANIGINDEEFMKRGFDRMSALMFEPVATSIKGNACQIGLPCDCIRNGLSRLLNEP